MAERKKDKYGLTSRQRKFAENRAAGMTLSDAYYDAGYSRQQKRSAAAQNACHLEEIMAVKKHIEYLQEIASLNALDSIEDRKAALIEIYQNATNDKDKLKAIDLLNRMHGDYIDKKEINANISGLTRSDRLDAMQDTLETLKKAWSDTGIEE